MNSGFRPKFTITNRITAGLTRLPVPGTADRHRAGPGVPGGRLSACSAQAGMTGWLEFFLEGLSTQLAEIRKRGEQAIRRDVIAKQHNLSDRQALALAHILVHGSLSIQDFERLCPRVTRRTLQRDLRLMVDKGVVAEKATSPTDPTKHYVLVDSPAK